MEVDMCINLTTRLPQLARLTFLVT